MPRNEREVRPNVFPVMTYRDAPAAIGWLAAAFGFEKRMVVPGPDGTIAHAELGFGPGAVMLGSMKEGDGAAKDHEGSGVYIAIDDVDSHCKRAKAVGAEILREPFDTDYGSRDYSARDPEGHVWYFGTYLPGD